MKAKSLAVSCAILIVSIIALNIVNARDARGESISKSLTDPEFDIRFAAISDTHVGSSIDNMIKEYFDTILLDIRKQQVHFGVIVGDSIDTTMGFFPEHMATLQSNFINKTSVPFFLTYGDHGKEWGKHQASFRIPESVFGGTFSYTSDGKTAKGWYFEQGLPYMGSLTYNNVHFVFLPALFADDIVMAWLSKDLEENKIYTTIIFDHYAETAGGMNDWARQHIKSILSVNPQVIALISGHTHLGFTPQLIAGNTYQFWTWAPAETKDSYMLNKKYLIYSIRQDGLYVFERDAVNDSSSLIYSLETSTTFLHKSKIQISLPYLIRDKQTVSIPFPEIQSAKLRIWGINATQSVEAATAPWMINDSKVSYQGTTNKQLGNEKYLSQVFQSNSVSNAPANWAYIDIFKERDLSKNTNVEYGIQLDMFATPFMKINRELQFINATSGKIVESGTNNHGSATTFLDFLYQVRSGNAGGTVAGGTFSKMLPSSFNNMTLRLSFGPGENSITTTTIDVGAWVHDRTFAMAPIAGIGSFTTDSVAVSLNGQIYDSGKLEPFEFAEMNVGTIKGDLTTDVTGSRIALVELVGEAEPVFLFVNPRDSLLNYDVTGSTIQINNNLYSTSATVANSILYSLRPSLLGSQVLDKSNSVSRFSVPTSIKLTDILDIVNANLASYSFEDLILAANLTSLPGTNTISQLFIPSGIYPNDEFKVEVDSSQWRYQWDGSNRLLTIWALAKSSAPFMIRVSPVEIPPEASPAALVLTKGMDQVANAGQVSGSFTIELRNGFGDPVNANTDVNVSLSTTSVDGLFDTFASGPFDGTIISVTIPAGSKSVEFFYKDTLAGDSRLLVSSSGLASASTTFVVKPGPLSSFLVDLAGPIPDQVAGVPFEVRVTALDAFDNVKTDYKGTVSLTTNDGTSPTGKKPSFEHSPHTFAPTDHGVFKFTKNKLYTAASDVHVTASDLSASVSNDSNDFNVFPAKAAKIYVTPEKPPEVRIHETEVFYGKVLDEFGNDRTTDSVKISWTAKNGVVYPSEGSSTTFTASGATGSASVKASFPGLSSVTKDFKVVK
jgi:hypothetical protein